MILNVIKPYFKARLENLGYRYWPDPFDFDNVPADVMREVFQVSVGAITGGVKNQNDQPFTVPVVVRIAVRGYADVDSADDSALLEIDRIVCESTLAAYRLKTVGIKNVVFQTASRRVVNTENDTAVVCELEFEVKLYSKE